MADSMPKSLAPLIILQVLWELSDPDHPLTQEKIKKENLFTEHIRKLKRQKKNG